MMDEEKVVKFSKDEQESLEHLSDLLHLFYHRNKNQHRRSTWWRHMSIFRRQLNSLVEEVRSMNEVPTSHLKRTQKKAKDKETQRQVSERLDFWKDVLVTKWQNAFSQVIADPRFGVLGLVLLAILAQVCQITGITAAFDDLGQAEVEKVLEQFGREQWESPSDLPHKPGTGDEDLGEVILRSDRQPEDNFAIASIPTGTSDLTSDSSRSRQIEQSKQTSSTSTSKLMRKKKQKRGNAIDDLFSGLD